MQQQSPHGHAMVGGAWDGHPGGLSILRQQSGSSTSDLRSRYRVLN